MEPGEATDPEGTVHGKGEQRGEVAHEAVDQHDGLIAGIDPDMNMHAEGNDAAGGILH